MSRKRLGIILTASFFGILLWTAVTLRDQYQQTLNVPLTIENIPEGMSIETPVPRFLIIRVRGDGWRLALLSTGTKFELHVPLSSLRPGKHVITLADVAERLGMPTGIQAVDMTPDSIFIGLGHSAERKVPVVFDASVSFRTDYGQVRPTEIQPESVVVRGAESVLRQVDSWKTTRASFENLRGTVDTFVPLEDSRMLNVTVAPPSVRVRIQVEPFAETTFSGLPVDVLSVPPSREVILIPPKIDIVVRGGIKQLQLLELSHVRASLDYSTIEADTTGVVSATVASPPGIQIVRQRPEHLHYIVRKRL